MANVLIDSAEFETYASDAEADEYLAGDFAATLWRAETDEDQKGRALVTSTRILNRMPWAADRNWPRPGVFEDDQLEEIPQPIIDASIILAKLIHAGSKVDDQASTASGIKRQRAGSVEVEYFIPTSDPQRLPTAVAELIAPYLGGLALAGSIASGVCEPSPTWPGYYPNGPL